ncbi:MAG: hypothetical protein NVS3B16_21740 [Vulcanimicrobiaceae bacterium]
MRRLPIIDERQAGFATDDRGSALIEMVIVAPLLALLMLGTVEVGTYMYDGIVVGNAARAGVQYGAQNILAASDSPGIAAAAKADAKQLSSLTITSITYCTCDSNHATTVTCGGPSPCATSDARDTYVSDTATATFKPFLTYPGLPSTLTIARSAVQQVTP